jgi:soluble lytic murein transglycosylase-like protein
MASKARFVPIILTADGREFEGKFNSTFDRLEARADRLNNKLKSSFNGGFTNADLKAIQNLGREQMQIDRISQRTAAAFQKNFAELPKEAQRAFASVAREAEVGAKAVARSEASKLKLVEINSRAMAKAAEQAARASERAKTEEFRQFERMERQKFQVAQREARAIERANNSAARDSSISWSTHLGISFFANLGARAVSSFIDKAKNLVSESEQIARQSQSAFKGIESISEFYKTSPQDAQKAIQELEAVKRGFLTTSDAALAMKPALQLYKGDVKAAAEIVDTYSRSAVFGRQATLGYAESIISAVEGVRNANAVTSDNAGLTKNLSVILKEFGFELQDLDSVQKGAAAREALLIGLRKEAVGQYGDLQKGSESYAGSVIQQEAAQRGLNLAIGELITLNPKAYEANLILTEQIKGYTSEVRAADSATHKFGVNAVDTYYKMKSAAIPALNAILNTVVAVSQAIGTIPQFVVGVVLRAIEIVLTAASKIGATLTNLIIDPINKAMEFAGSDKRIQRQTPYDFFGANQLKIGQGGTALMEDALKLPQAMNDYWAKAKQQFGEARNAWKQVESAESRMAARQAEATRLQGANEKTRLERETGLNKDVDQLRKNAEEEKQNKRNRKTSALDPFASGLLRGNLAPPQPADPQLKAMIEKYAATFGIPTWLAFAQISAESGFRAAPKHHDGVFGLTQMKPATASAALGRKVTGRQLENPEVALTAWGAEMTGLYKRYGGNWDLALFGYHNGPGEADFLYRQMQMAKTGALSEEQAGKNVQRYLKGRPRGTKYARGIMAYQQGGGGASPGEMLTDSQMRQLHFMETMGGTHPCH